MNDKKLRIQVNNALKYASESLVFSSIETKYKGEGLDFILNKEKVGRLGYAFVSSRFAQIGSQLGFYLDFTFYGGKLPLILKQLNLSFGNYFQSHYLFGFTSLSYLYDKFFDEGTVSFFENDDINEKCSLVMNGINELYTKKIQNFIHAHLNVIDDIFEEPKNYGYPLTFILIACYINNRKDLVENVIKKAKSMKLYDSNDDRIKEILNKLDQLP